MEASTGLEGCPLVRVTSVAGLLHVKVDVQLEQAWAKKKKHARRPRDEAVCQAKCLTWCCPLGRLGQTLGLAGAVRVGLQEVFLLFGLGSFGLSYACKRRIFGLEHWA